MSGSKWKNTSSSLFIIEQYFIITLLILINNKIINKFLLYLYNPYIFTLYIRLEIFH